jgi:hypothetical protein
MLVTSKKTLLTVFTAASVAGMGHNVLENIAEEELKTKDKRVRFRKEISLLQKAKKIIS